ncbi:MAG: peptidoglycan glycosyltransferase [Verrucomicrobia bacterium]|nr:peptidoglycan glycosyltransferase [Verrucomicrobiota bacterium]
MEKENSSRQWNPRIGLLYGVVVLAMLALSGALGYRQIWKNEHYLEAAERQNFRRILMPGPRGLVYDREGRLLIGNRAVFSAVVYLNELRPEFRREYVEVLRLAREQGTSIDRQILNVQARSNVVQRYLDNINALLGREDSVDSRRIERHFSQSLLLPFTLIADLAPHEYALLVEQLPVDSPVQVITDSTRFYPFDNAAAHALGFVTTSNDFPDFGLPGEDLTTFRFEAKIGRSGLERAFDELLQGRPGTEIWSVDPGGFQQQRFSWQPPAKGEDKRISIDIDLQLAGERAMAGKVGAFVALDVYTGEVLAISSKPDYNLNELTPFISHTVDQRIREEGGWLNRAMQGLYPPGSTFKLVTAIAGLQYGFIETDTVINCRGFHMVGNRIFRCHNRNGHGHQDLVEALRDSCNVFFYERGVAMGIQRIANTARMFGLDSPTGIELPGESRRMLVPDPAWKRRRFGGEGWFDGDTANTSIGQGFLLLTPLQMAAFTASLARGETITRPTLRYLGGQAVDHGGQSIPVSQEHLQLVLNGMRESGIRGTGRLASLPNLVVAGKTGTAQVRKDGRPSTLAWYVGFVPVDNPQVAIAVLVEDVTDREGAIGGGSTAAPVAREIVRAWHAKQSIPHAALAPGLP